MKFLNGFSLFALALCGTVTLSCGGTKDTKPFRALEVLFRDRTEVNAVEGDFTFSLNDDVARTGIFEDLRYFDSSFETEIGDLLSFEFFGALDGKLTGKVVSEPDKKRVVIEVHDAFVKFLESDWLEINGVTPKRNKIDQNAGQKNLLRDAEMNLSSIISASTQFGNENMPKATDSLKEFREKYLSQKPSLNKVIYALESFILEFPVLAEEAQQVLAIYREYYYLTDSIGVASDFDAMNPLIFKRNDLIPKLSASEFALETAIEKILNG